jgi:hypothetical protein
MIRVKEVKAFTLSFWREHGKDNMLDRIEIWLGVEGNRRCPDGES